MFGWERPEFAHLPLIMRPDGKGKLSKRDGLEFDFPVIPLEWKNPENGEVYKGYRETGFLPEAMLNILALLGWNPGHDIEMMSLSEMVDMFTLERVNKAGARYDLKKAIWFQKNYIMMADVDRLATDLIGDPNVAKWIHDNRKDIVGAEDWIYLVRVCSAMREKTPFVSEFYDAGKYFFVKPETIDVPEDIKLFYDNLAARLTTYEKITHDEARAEFDSAVSETGTDPRAAGKYLRDSITGMKSGPPIFEIISILGPLESVNRMLVKESA
jgi:glutamyl-tRNA synthetase